jgi:hypothetical protein
MIFVEVASDYCCAVRSKAIAKTGVKRTLNPVGCKPLHHLDTNQCCVDLRIEIVESSSIYF